MQIYWKKRKRLHKKRVQLLEDYIDLGHQRGRRFIVLGHQYGRRDVTWKHSIACFKGETAVSFLLIVTSKQKEKNNEIRV